MSQDFSSNNGMITAAFAQQFHDAFDIESQQKESRFVQAVNNRGKIQGYSFTVNDMASIEMESVTGRFEDTKWSVPESGSRLVTMADYGLHVPIEPRDLPKLLADPQGAYMSNLVVANTRANKLLYFDNQGQPQLTAIEDSSALELASALIYSGAPFGNSGTNVTSRLFRVKVWRVD